MMTKVLVVNVISSRFYLRFTGFFVGAAIHLKISKGHAAASRLEPSLPPLGGEMK
jgi:hypothetical protein